MDIINSLEIPENYMLVTEERNVIFVKKPENLDELPEIDEKLVKKEHFKLENKESIIEYFKTILEKNVRILALNGYINDDRSRYGYNCDYCRFPIGNNGYYCYHCYKDMCTLCFGETSEEIALANGSKKYHERKDKLNLCRSSNKIEPRGYIALYGCEELECDDCEKLLEDDRKFYSKSDNEDLCLDCKEKRTNESFELLDRDDPNSYIFGRSGLESMLYWFPVISGKNGTSILVNLNKDSKQYKKICLRGSDDHGREGIYITELTLEEVLTKLNEIIESAPKEDITEGFYGDPIHYFMEKLGMQVYYG